MNTRRPVPMKPVAAPVPAKPGGVARRRLHPSPAPVPVKPAYHRPAQAAPDVRRLGDPAPTSMQHNCLTCMRRTVCADPRKAFNYRCTLWREQPIFDEGFFDGGGAKLDGESALKAARSTGPTKTLDLDDLISRADGRGQHQGFDEMIEEVLKSESSVAPDLRIDDRDIPEAANYLEWVRGPNFSGSATDLFPRQHDIMMHVNGEYCPRASCTDVTWLANIQVDTDMANLEDKVSILHHGKCLKCGVSKSELIVNHELNDYLSIAGLAGQRSGKTAVVNINEGYSLHKWVKLPNPQRVFGTLEQQNFVFTYVALDFQQIRRNMWDPFVDFLTDSPWFKAYHGLLNHFGEKYGEELYSFKDIFLRYRHRGLFLHASGPNKRTLRGATRARALIDEIGWFPFGKDNQDKTRMSAEEIHTSLIRSMLTLQSAYGRLRNAGHNSLPKPIMSCISSPSQHDDMIMRLHRSAQGSRTSYTFRYATWEMNPNLPRNEPSIEAAFETNPESAMRDLGCEPPLSSSAWIKDVKNAQGIFQRARNNVVIRQRRYRTRSGEPQTTAESNALLHSAGGRVMTLDAGEVANHFAFTIARPHDGQTVIEGMGEIVPSRDASINFTATYDDVILPLATMCGVQVIVTDRWQHLKMVQDLEAAIGVIPVQRRCVYADFNDLREAVYDQTVQMPRLEMSPDKILAVAESYPDCFLQKPCAHLLFQMLTVRDYPGNTVAKGQDTQDDLFRTVVLAHWALQQPDILARLGEVNLARPTMVGVVGSLGGGGGGNSRSAGTGSSSIGTIGGYGRGGGNSGGAVGSGGSRRR